MLSHPRLRVVYALPAIVPCPRVFVGREGRESRPCFSFFCFSVARPPVLVSLLHWCHCVCLSSERSQYFGTDGVELFLVAVCRASQIRALLISRALLRFLDGYDSDWRRWLDWDWTEPLGGYTRTHSHALARSKRQPTPSSPIASSHPRPRRNRTAGEPQPANNRTAHATRARRRRRAGKEPWSTSRTSNPTLIARRASYRAGLAQRARSFSPDCQGSRGPTDGTFELTHSHCSQLRRPHRLEPAGRPRRGPGLLDPARRDRHDCHVCAGTGRELRSRRHVSCARKLGWVPAGSGRAAERTTGRTIARERGRFRVLGEAAGGRRAWRKRWQSRDRLSPVDRTVRPRAIS